MNLSGGFSVSPTMPLPRSRWLRILGVFLVLAVGAAGLRAALEPEETPAPGLTLPEAERDRIGALARASAADAGRRLEDLSGVDVLLVGEEHFYVETQAWLARLLDGVTNRRIALLLELPRGFQPEVDRWVATGRSERLEEAMRSRDALPFGDLLAWAHRNRSRLAAIVAMDEDGNRIFWNRVFLRDTRNRTMADAVLSARRAGPGDLVVAYGGQMHMLLAGRYRYDRKDRVPAGARLLREGVPRERMRSVLLSGERKAPVCDAWAGPGALDMADAIGAEPWALFVDYPLFRVGTSRDLFDFFVHLGPLTRVSRPEAGAR
ncbi:MAG: ChaN family lipoprotein [Thermoanaerobaculia bacterium]|nr:ChaN family lipoprotein [Thermoanaerobaculia bacterium]